MKKSDPYLFELNFSILSAEHKINHVKKIKIKIKKKLLMYAKRRC